MNLRPNQGTAFPIFASLCLIAFLVFGGGTRPGLLSDVVTQIIAIPLLLWAIWKLRQDEARVVPRLGIALIVLVISFPLAQLLPVRTFGPEGLGRQLQDEALTAAGHARSATLSVAGDATMLSILSLLPAVAMFFATLVLRQRERRGLAFIIIGFSFASVVLGLLQISQGPASPLRFYEMTNADDAVGFFANRNHFSALMNCALVLASACLLFVASRAGIEAQLGPWRQVAIIGGFTLIVSLMAAQAMARSRAGVGLAAVALGLSFAMMPGLGRSRDARAKPLRAMAVAMVLGLMLAVPYGTFRMVERFGPDPLQDARRQFAQNTYDAILSFLPFGSGLGTFTQVYPSFERLETALVSTYVNRAHNDLLEYALEGGMVSVIVLAAAIVYLCVCAIPLWRPKRPVTLDLMLQRAAACVLVLILLHSIFDYPLRTGAMLALLAVAAGLLLSPWREPASEGMPSARATRTNRHRSGLQQHREADKRDDVGSLAAPAPARAAWGEDVAWPDAWKADSKKPGE